MVTTEEQAAEAATTKQTDWLQIKNLRKTYGKFTAVKDIQLNIKQGEFLTLLGGSGSGKTTTLLSVAGFLEPTSGEILLNGKSILDKPAHKRNIGMVFQQYSLFPHMSIFDNVAFPLKMRKIGKAEIKERVKNILSLVELDGFAKRKPNQLSGGQQQRVALARALVFEPNILLMDEPLAALDKKLRETMQLEIRQLHEKLDLTIIYVTHDQEEALKMSDRIAVFNKGSIEQIGTPEDLYDRPGSQFVAQFLGNSNAIHGKVIESDGDYATIENSQGEVFKASSDQEYANGDAVVVMVRPEKVDISTTKKESLNLIEAKVSEMIYLGESYRYILETAAGETVVVKKQIRYVDEKVFHIGDTVYVTWELDNAVALPSNGEEA
ncbi:MAG TPA: ABC transporter ATP-binding protein [Virgibacillus sp.]|nr:ABC transporter ATP-binding protein [Virgibacillus sp.]